MLEFLNALNKGGVRKYLLPMEMASGWPSVVIKSGQLCVVVPFFRTQRVENGKSLLYPLMYTMTLTWPNAKMVEFSALRYNKEYRAVDFSKPVGIYPHDAAKDFQKNEYTVKRDKLFGMYDELISCVLDKNDFAGIEEMKKLFQLLMEPSLYPMYLNISGKFFRTYCGL
jgi:hypothetical protein